MNLIVLVVDGLGASFLGPYGNTWFETPETNRLASNALTLEYALTASPQLDECYRSFWFGCHPLQRRGPAPPSLAAAAAHCGMHSALISDDPLIDQFDGVGDFAERVEVPVSQGRTPARSVAHTQLARVFDQTLDWLATAHQPFFLWVHSRGMYGPWDAPYELRLSFKDEDDPDPPRLVKPPKRRVAEDVDPDELLGLSFAYATQVVVMDECLGAILNASDALEAAGQPTSLMLTSPRGFPLGQHGTIGIPDCLYGDVLHVPWFVRTPRWDNGSWRSHALVQSPDVHATSHDLLGPSPGNRPEGAWGHSVLALGDDERWPREGAYVQSAGQRAIRTREWFMRSADDRHELYAKPDDRYEVNEVSDRCPEIVTELQAEWLEFQHELDA